MSSAEDFVVTDISLADSGKVPIPKKVPDSNGIPTDF